MEKELVNSLIGGFHSPRSSGEWRNGVRNNILGLRLTSSIKKGEKDWQKKKTTQHKGEASKNDSAGSKVEKERTLNDESGKVVQEKLEVRWEVKKQVQGRAGGGAVGTLGGDQQKTWKPTSLVRLKRQKKH